MSMVQALQLTAAAVPGRDLLGGRLPQIAGEQHASAATALLFAAKAQTGAYFGWSVSASGTRGLVGAPRIGGRSCGHAYLYTKGGGTFHRTVLVNASCGPGDMYGWSVSIWNRIYMIGAPGAHHDAGAVYALTLAPAKGRQLVAKPVVGPKRSKNWPAPGDLFGSAVAVSGNYAVMTAAGTNHGAGAAYIFKRSGSSWHRKLTFRGTGNSLFGAAAAISGPTAVVGAPGQQGKPGSVYIYVESDGFWYMTSVLTDPGDAASDLFGSAIAVSASTVIVGASGTRRNRGAVYIYRPAGGSWRLASTLKDPLPNSSSARFGASVAASGSGSRIRVVVGAPGQYKCGQVMVYGHPRKAWRLRARIVNPFCRRGSGFGASVATSSNIAIVGSPGYRNHAGNAFVATLPS